MKPVIVLVRHGHPDTPGDRLVGRAPGIPLSDRGVAQAADVAERLSALKPAAVSTSGVQRCAETAGILAAAAGVEVTYDDRLAEIDFGDWQGQKYSTLMRKPLWRDVQHRPSTVRFPGGESFVEAQQRAVEAIADIASSKRVYFICSHADVIKLVAAHYLGVHIDLFQRIVVGHASVTAIALGDSMPRVLCVGDTGVRADDLIPKG